MNLVVEEPAAPSRYQEEEDTSSASPQWKETRSRVFRSLLKLDDMSVVHAKHNRKRGVMQLVREIIRGSDKDEIDRLEEQLYGLLGGSLEILSEIALDSEALINVRAMAARLYIARVGGEDYRPASTSTKELIESLATHPSPLIRLGALLGFADAGNWNRVRSYCGDDHPTVAEEAAELLDESADR